MSTDEQAGDEKPDITEDEQADINLDELAKKVEDEAGAAPTADEDTDEDEDEVEDLVPDTASWGDKYVALLALALAGVVREYGEIDADVDEDESAVQAKAEEIMELATFGPLDLARDFDRLLAKHGQPADMPPEVAVVLGTVALAAVVIVTDTDLVADFMEAET